MPKSTHSIAKDLIAAGLGSAATAAYRKTKGEKVGPLDLALGAAGGASLGRAPRALRAMKGPLTTSEKAFVKGHRGLGSAALETVTYPARLLSKLAPKNQKASVKKRWARFDKRVHEAVGAPLARGDVRLGRGLAELPGGKLLFKRFGAPVWVDTKPGVRKKFQVTRATGPMGVAGATLVPLYAALKASEDFEKKLAPKIEKRLIEKGIMAPSPELRKKEAMSANKEKLVLSLSKLASDRKSILGKVAEMQKIAASYTRREQAEDFLLSLLKDPQTSPLVPKMAEAFLEKRNSLAKMESEDFELEKRATLIAAKDGGTSYMHGVPSDKPLVGTSGDPLGDWLAGTVD